MKKRKRPMRKPMKDVSVTVSKVNENAVSNPAMYEIRPSEVDVGKYRKKGRLNPDFWKDGKLDSRIRLRLLDIADDFIEELGINWVKPSGIIFTGSLANYNWHDESDVDVHVLMDYSKIHGNKEFVKRYFDAKKEMWSEEHDSLTIKGFPVEMYVEDDDAKSDPSGAYSLEKGEWLREPVDGNDAKFNEGLVKRKAAEYITRIDGICDTIAKEKDRHKSEALAGELKHIFKKLKMVRKNGLESESKEMSTGNIIWKVVKHHGSIRKLWDAVNDSYDTVNSIDEAKKKRK